MRSVSTVFGPLARAGQKARRTVTHCAERIQVHSGTAVVSRNPAQLYILCIAVACAVLLAFSKEEAALCASSLSLSLSESAVIALDLLFGTLAGAGVAWVCKEAYENAVNCWPWLLASAAAPVVAAALIVVISFIASAVLIVLGVIVGLFVLRIVLFGVLLSRH